MIMRNSRFHVVLKFAIVSILLLTGIPAYAQAVIIEAIEPNEGYQGESLNVHIYGELFDAKADVTFSNPDIDVLQITWIDQGELITSIFIGQEAEVGLCDIRVENPQGMFDVAQDIFEVLDAFNPAFSFLNPDSGFQGDSSIMTTLTGSDLPVDGTFEFSPPGGPVIVNATYVSATLYNLVLDIPEDAIPGIYDLTSNFPGVDLGPTLVSAFEVFELPTTYELYLEDNLYMMGIGGDSEQTDFLFGIDSNKPDDVDGPFYLYASEAVDPVSGEIIGLSYIDIAPSRTDFLTPGMYEMAIIRTVIPQGIPTGDYEGTITFSAPSVGLQETASFTISVQPGPVEILYPELNRQELEIDLIWPGSDNSTEPEEIVEETPLFEWASSARYFDFHLFDVTPTDEYSSISGATEYLRPIYEEHDIADTILFYPLAAEPLVPGHTYAWQVEAKDIPAFDPRVVNREPQIIQSEIFYFKYIDLMTTAGAPEVLSIQVTPEYIGAELQTDYEFEAILELEGPGFADVNWKVVPSSAALIVSRNEYAYVTPLKSGFISIIAEAGDMSAYAVMRVGEADLQTSVELNTQTIARLAEKIDSITGSIAEWTALEERLQSSQGEQLALKNEMDSSITAFGSALREAYKILEPFFLTGKASLIPADTGDWIQREPFGAYLGLYTSDPSACEKFIASNLIGIDAMIKNLDDRISEANALAVDHQRAVSGSEDLLILAIGLQANIEHEITSVNNELDLVIASLESGSNPFCSLT